MIDIIKYTPKALSAQSRDYQILARLYSALFNVSKMYIDTMGVWNEKIDHKLAELRAKTLNFDFKRIWKLDDLEAITVCFKYLIMNKGTFAALNTLVNILMKVENIDATFDSSDRIRIEDNCIEIRIEKNILSLGILEDILKYILPAGLTYRVIEYKKQDISGDWSTTNIGYADKKISQFNRKKLLSAMTINNYNGNKSYYDAWQFDKDGKHIYNYKANTIVNTYIYGNDFEGKDKEYQMLHVKKDSTTDDYVQIIENQDKGGKKIAVENKND